MSVIVTAFLPQQMWQCHLTSVTPIVCYLTVGTCFTEWHILSVITHESVISHQAQPTCVSPHMVTTGMWLSPHICHKLLMTVTSQLSQCSCICHLMCLNAQGSHHTCVIAHVIVTSHGSQHTWECHLTPVTHRVWLSPHISHMPPRSVTSHQSHCTCVCHITTVPNSLVRHPTWSQLACQCHHTSVTRLMIVTSHLSQCLCDCHLMGVMMCKCHNISVTLCLLGSHYFCLDTHGSVTWHLSQQECD